MLEIPFITTAETISTAVVLGGFVGGLVRGLVGISKTLVKHKKIRFGRFIFSLVVAVVSGAVASAVIGGSWAVSVIAGYAGADLLEGLYKIVITSKFFGVSGK